MVENIDLDLLTRYVQTIRFMQECRFDIELYTICEEKRQDLHNKILKIAETDRQDEKFNLALATLVEEMLR